MTIKDTLLGRIIAIPLAKPSLAGARVIVPESTIVAESVVATRTRLYVTYRNGGPSTVRIFSLEGKAQGEVPVAPSRRCPISRSPSVSRATMFSCAR